MGQNISNAHTTTVSSLSETMGFTAESGWARLLAGAPFLGFPHIAPPNIVRIVCDEIFLLLIDTGFRVVHAHKPKTLFFKVFAVIELPRALHCS